MSLPEPPPPPPPALQPPPPPPFQVPAQAAWPPRPSTEKNGLGVLSLVLGILSIVLFGLLSGIPAIILGVKSRAAAQQGRATNGGQGTGGLVTGIIGSVLSTLLVVLAVIGLAVGHTVQNEFQAQKTTVSASGAQASGGSGAAAYNDLPVGRSIQVSGTNNGAPFALELTVISMKTSKAPLDTYGDKPKGTYVGLLVEYSCTQGTCSYNPFDFTVRSESGVEADRSFPPFEPALQSGDLRAGRKARGYLTYDLASGKYTLEYRSTWLDEDSASWAFSV